MLDSKFTRTDSETPAQGGGSAISDFARSFFYAAFEEPIEGVTQIVDQLGDTDLQSKVEMVARPDAAEFNSFRYWVQQSGSALGALIPIGLTALALRGANLSPLSRTAWTGFLSQSVLCPTAGGENDEFFHQRLMNGGTGAVAFAAMSGTGIGLGKLSQSLSESTLKSCLEHRLVQGTISGAVGGCAGSETESILNRGRLASWQDAVHGAYTMSIVGGGFSLMAKAGLKSEIRKESASNAGGRDPSAGPSFSDAKPSSEILMDVRKDSGDPSAVKNSGELKFFEKRDLMYAPTEELLSTFKSNQIILNDILAGKSKSLPVFGFHGTTSERSSAIFSDKVSNGDLCYASYEGATGDGNALMKSIAAAINKADTYTHAREGDGRGPLIVFDLFEYTKQSPDGGKQLWASLFKQRTFSNQFLGSSTYGENTLRLTPENFASRVLGVLDNSQFEKYRGESWPRDLRVSMERGELLQALKAQEQVNALLKLVASPEY